MSIQPTTLSQADITDLLSLVSQGFERASQRHKLCNQSYNIGGYPVRVQFADLALLPYFSRSIRHLQTNSIEPPRLTIYVWDNACTQSELPLLLSSYISLLSSHYLQYSDSRGELIHASRDRLHIAFYPYPNRLSVLDRQTNTAYYWIEDASQLPYHEVGASFRVILHWWMSQQQAQFVHAGAVGTGDGGVLIAGKGGSGKSTTTLACLDSELCYASDDYSLVSLTPEPTVYSLYNTAKLTEHAIQAFPQLARSCFNLERLATEKATLFVQESYPDKVISQFPLRAILIPQVTGRTETTYHPITPGKALLSLSISTLFQLPGANQAALELMSTLVRQTPCYSLNLGTQLNKIPGVISKILEALKH